MLSDKSERGGAIIAAGPGANGAIAAGPPLRKIERVYAFKAPPTAIAENGNTDWTAQINGIVNGPRGLARNGKEPTIPDDLTHPRSFYTQTLADTGARPALTATQDAQTVIIGGGLAGVTLAYELAVAGQRPVVLESQDIGHGASGRNGGFVSPGFSCGDDAIRRRVGDEHADQLFALSLDAVDYVRDRIAQIGDQAGINPTNGIMSARRQPVGDSLLRSQAWLAERGYETQVLSRKEVQGRLHSQKYHAALRSDRGFHIHPLNYLLALARLAERAGAVIHTGSAVRSLSRRAGGGFDIQTQTGAIRAETVAIATGGYTEPLTPRLHRAFVPVATYVMASHPAPDLLGTAISTTDAIADERRAGDYYRVIDGDARLIWGGGISVTDRNPMGVIKHLRASMLDSYPQLEPLTFETSWSGWMSYARHQMPQIGQLEPDLWHLTGFGGHGLNTTAMAARIVGEAITGQSDRWRLFAPWGLDWTGGGIGRIAAQATYSWLRWRDRRDEAKAS